MACRTLPLKSCITLCIDHRGKTPKKLGGAWAETGYRALSAKNIKTGTIVQPDTIRYVDEELYRKWMPDEIERGDILVTSEAPFGQVYIWNSEEKIVLSQRLFGIRPNRSICDPHYLYYWMCGRQFQADMHGRATGTTVIGLRQPALLSCEVCLPDLDTQRRIVAVLKVLDDKLITNRHINDYLFECCMAKMHDIVDTSGITMKVEDFCEAVYSGGTPSTKKPAYWNGGLPWLSSGETRARFIIDTEKTITELGVKESSTKLAKAGDVVMASAGQGFTRGQTSMLFFDTYVNQSVVVMRPRQDYGVYLLLMLAAQYDNLRAWSDSTSTRGSMSGRLLKQFELPYIDANQAKVLTDFAAPMFAMTENNLRESKALSQARDALLPKLMSGEIDVSEVELPMQPNNHLPVG